MKKKNIPKQLNPIFTAQTVTVGFLTVLCSLYLLFVGPGGYTAIAENKFIAFVAMMGVYLAAMLAAALRNKQTVSCFHKGWKPDTVEVLLGLYVLFSLISAIRSPFGVSPWLGTTRKEGFLTIFLYVLLFLLVSHFGGHWEKVIYVLGGSVTIFAVICLLQFNGSNPFHLYPEGLNYYGADVSYKGQYLGTIGNADLVAGFMCLVIPLMLLYVILVRKDIWRFWLVIPLVLCLWVTALMKVSAAWLGLLMGLLLSLPVLLHGRKQRCIAGTVVLVLLLLGMVTVYALDMGTETFHELHEMLHGRVENSFGSYRVEIWKDALAIAKDNVLFGSGPDTMSCWGTTIDYDYHSAEFTTVVDCAHNELLNILANQGIFALISYVVAVGILLLRWICGAEEHQPTAICGAACLCYLIQAMFGMSMCLVAPYFWVMLAIVQGEYRHSRFVRPNKEGIVSI